MANPSKTDQPKAKTLGQIIDEFGEELDSGESEVHQAIVDFGDVLDPLVAKAKTDARGIGILLKQLELRLRARLEPPEAAAADE